MDAHPQGSRKSALKGWQRQEGNLLGKIPTMTGWVSPLLGIKFDWVTGQELVLSRPDGQRFLSSVELDRRLQRSEIQLMQEREWANRLADRMHALGIDPDREDDL